jgi:phosphate transport system ATP-binding protein
MPRNLFERRESIKPSALSVRELRVAYGRNEVLKGITMSIEPGLVTAIIGPSGCGKSTLLSALNRLSDLIDQCHVSGEVLLDEKNIFQMDPILLRRRVGMVFQKPNPFPMSIRENVLYGIKAAGLRVNHAYTLQESLARAALWEEMRGRLGDSALRLSLGQQQRLCLARCLAVSPAVVLMDEPTASLDPTSSTRIEASVQALRGEYTIVIVTHNLQQARRVSDFTAFLFDGELIEIDRTEKLFSKPERELTWKYVNGALE